MKCLPSPLQRRFITSDEAVTLKKQHQKPCADCPFGRNAITGWLGMSDFTHKLATPQEWIFKAHGEVIELCHCTTNQQCAGLAIFRANVFKRPHHALILKSNTELVFANDIEFIEHHTRKKKLTNELH